MKTETTAATLKSICNTSLAGKMKAVALFTAFLCLAACKRDAVPLAAEDTSAGTTFAAPKLKANASVVKGWYRDGSTSVTTIDGEPGYTKVVVYTVGPMDVAAGDVVTVHVQRQFGLSGVAPIMVAGGVIAATSSAAVDNTSTGFIGQILGWSGSNLTAAERGREVVTRTGSYKFNSAATGVYINAVFYAQALTGAGGSGNLTLPTGNYGELVAVLESGVTWQQTTASPLPYNSSQGRDYVPFTPVLNVHNTIGPVTIPANSIAEVRYDAEATTNLFDDDTYQTYGRNIIEGTSAAATSGTNLTKQTQVGITHREHHSTWSTAGYLNTTAGLTNAYFNSVVYTNGWEGENLYMDPGSTYLYNRMNLEVRPTPGYFGQDDTNNISTVTGTPQVLYSVGPINVNANDIFEVRYQAAFSMTAWCTLDSQIIRASSPTATTGVVVQNPLARGFDPSYYRNNLFHSTAEKVTTAATGQYYNVVVWTIQGSTSVTPQTWGELEVIKR